MIHSMRRTAAWLALLAALVVAAAGGCSSPKFATLRSVPKSPLVEQLHLTSKKPRPSDRTMQLLRVYNLTEDLKGDPQVLLAKVQKTIEQDPSADKVYASAELSFLAGKKLEKQNPRLALQLYGASVVHAYQYLFDPRFGYLRNPYDPQFRGACDLYNGSLEGGLRLVCKDQGLQPGKTYTIAAANGNWDVTCVLREARWRPEDFDHFEFVSEYEIKGLSNQYQTYGLGVPLIAVRRSYSGEPAAAQYYPPDLSFPVTAFLRTIPGTNQDGADARARHRGVLELYDPLTTDDIAVDNVRVPLEGDLTTPLAYFLSNPALSSLATVGLLQPERLLALRPGGKESAVGLYMVQPYEPGKIPVVLVHGLWSSPMTWMQMFNDLRASPEIRDHYQFWFYLYPTAQPFWITAARMREDLARARQALDPQHQEPSLDQMVLVGHSMGGLLSWLQTIHSGDEFWKLVSDKPFDQIKAEPEVRQRLAATFFFEPNPSVRRVITIGTPHRGSRFSNQTTQWLAGKLIKLPERLVQGQQRLFRENRDVLRPDNVLRIEDSIDSLSPDDPFFPVMLASHEAPWVTYHNIIGVLPKKGVLGKLAAGSDGVVTYESAHMDDAESELVVPADHTTVHSHPLAVLEVHRILLEHLSQLRGSPDGGPTQVYPAGFPSPSRDTRWAEQPSGSRRL